MIKYSIRRQMTAIFIGLFSLILGLVLIINNAFLDIIICLTKRMI